MIHLRIRNKRTGRVEMMPETSWNLLTNRNEWEIVEPEMQKTPAPVGKAVRSVPVVETPPAAEPFTRMTTSDPVIPKVQPAKPKRVPKRKGR